jgi:hypothetical protein
MLWISLTKEFHNPHLCMSMMDKLSDEQLFKFTNAIRNTAKEFNDKMKFDQISEN